MVLKLCANVIFANRRSRRTGTVCIPGSVNVGLPVGTLYRQADDAASEYDLHRLSTKSLDSVNMMRCASASLRNVQRGLSSATCRNIGLYWWNGKLRTLSHCKNMKKIRPCLINSEMPNGEFFSPDKAKIRRNTLCISRIFTAVWRKKARCWAFCHFSNKA